MMPFAGVASYLALVVAAGVLFYAAATDLQAYKIPNEIVLTLVVLFLIHAALSGRWVYLHWNVAFAALSFGLMLVCYSAGLMGGGDLKLMSVALLWSGPRCAVLLALIIAIVALSHALMAHLGWLQAQRHRGRMKIAFAPSIAAGLIGIFMLGCLSPQ